MKAFPVLSWILTSCGLSIANIVTVTGVHSGVDASTSQVPVRMSITDLEKSGPAWDLFIQGLQEFQQMPEDDPLSYFQISGIHGRPYATWNGVEQADGAPLLGYCTHNEVLFGIWHRPLLALFEQYLSKHIHAVAAKYTGALAAKYQKAADSVRLPFWDWAIDKQLPIALIRTNVTITGPDGAPLTIPNPLLKYRFQQFPLNATLFPPNYDLNLASFPETERCPDPVSRMSNPVRVDANILAIDMAETVYNFYTRLSTFEEMSTTANSGSSIESLHNDIHMAVGGYHPVGHLTQLAYAGFDPVFMIHHASIDRHVAIWQAIYYQDAMFNSSYATDTGNYATTPGTIITNESPLKPFYDENGKFHTPNSMRDIEKLGYTYPELQGSWNSQEEKSQAVRAQINKLYSLNGPPPADPDQGGWSVIINNLKTRGEKNRPVKAKRQQKNEYFIRTEVNKTALYIQQQLPAILQVWLGNQLVGRVALLEAPRKGTVHSELPLQGTITRLASNAQRRDDASGQGSAVQSLLIDELTWEVIKGDGSMLDLLPAAVQVELHVEDVKEPDSDSDFPQYGQRVKLMDVPRRSHIETTRRSRRSAGIKPPGRK